MSSLPGPGFYTDPMGEPRWWDGTNWGILESEAPGQEPSEVVPPQDGDQSPDTSKSSKSKWVWLSVGAVATLLLVLTFGVERWEKVIVPEQPETFTTVEVESGVYSVEMDSKNPCWIDQYWYDCIEEYVHSYNFACADRYLDAPSSRLCESYGAMIDDMKAENADGWAVVSELGSWGRLSYAPIMETERVSNNDYRPAKTREAVCVLWVFVECQWHGGDSETVNKEKGSKESPSDMPAVPSGVHTS